MLRRQHAIQNGIYQLIHDCLGQRTQFFLDFAHLYLMSDCTSYTTMQENGVKIILL
uniref:Uncharacterized protein n=1 Tax=Amphimedon queenslandica TaxID=400682 RepID=A0A1X7UL30_AMPQE